MDDANTGLLTPQYLLYLTLSLGVTWWVGRTLFKNGAAFLQDTFVGKERIAESVNHLLLVGFYLVNGGWIVRNVANEGRQVPFTVAAVITNITQQFGTVLLLLGGMHFLNLFVLNRMRRRAQDQADAVRKTQMWTVPAQPVTGIPVHAR